MQAKSSWVGGVLSVVAAAVMVAVITTPAAAAPAPTVNLDFGLSEATAGSKPSADEVDAIVRQLEYTFGSPTVVRNGAHATVTFTDREGTDYEYGFTAMSEPAGPNTSFDAKWNRWELNRAETRDLQIDAQNAAVVYAIAAVFGCTPCLVGAAIEGNWAAQAGTFYGRGHCAQIYFWLTIGEYWGGYCR